MYLSISLWMHLTDISVNELTTFYILRWVNNVFHILLKIWHIIVWFGPNCLGKSTPSFRIYDMIKNMPKCLSHHAFIIVKMYIMLSIALYEHGHQWLWCLPVALFYTGVDVMCGDAWRIGILLNNALHIYQQIWYWQLVMLPMFEITSCRVVEKYTTHI